ncbi:hypothetical protein QJ857_gp0460 [Tupanvirus soda lake]|uniref:DUF1308 domain-containing protein n=2 Tax=Tupanvirus TaxID=2094720 RepID=A0A6N1NNQ9_9VIRU|nr:hypothetical protein QJ857_gp0460 [Tupanvirus soda lake]QKU35580.1 hypothetical protein [Tupanvirus soda lake]
MSIENWANLIDQLSKKNNNVFQKLLVRVKQFLRSYQKNDETFDLSTVIKNHTEIFNTFKLTYEQLLIEEDIIDIFVEMPSLAPSSKNNIIFNMIGIGKWIKFHGGNASRIFFFDEEKTMISDKPLADFLNKIDEIRENYTYFGMAPNVYYKFKTMPSEDVVDYLKKFNVTSLEFDQKTPLVNYPKSFGNNVLLDQTMMLTLCSNLSYGLSESYYRTPEDKSKEIMIKNKEKLDAFLSDKKILVNEHVYEQTKFKVNQMGGPLEKQRFEELCKKIIVVPDAKNLRFYYLKDIELICASVAERERATIITGNQRLCNKIDTYYQEIPYQLFYGAQLVESKFE